MNLIVLSSSRGTTFEAVLERIKDGTLTSRCLGLITDRLDRGCIEKAKKFDIPFLVVDRMKDETREAYDDRLQTAIEELGGDGKDTVIAALGWMWIFSPSFVHAWRHRIINVHPSLLPNYPGAHSLQDALSAGDTETGMTIHLIDEGIDTGKILLQKKCPILPQDTLETLKAREQELEKEWYPKVLGMIEMGQMMLPSA